MGGPFASIAGGLDSGKPAGSYLPEGVTTAIMKEPGFGRGRDCPCDWGSNSAVGLDQWFPVYLPFRASWRMATRSYPRFLRPLYSFRMAGFLQYNGARHIILDMWPRQKCGAQDEIPLLYWSFPVLCATFYSAPTGSANELNDVCCPTWGISEVLSDPQPKAHKHGAKTLRQGAVGI